jgi:para-nitrobenzyl esterase
MQQLIERATAVGITSLSEGGLMFQPVVDGVTMPKRPLEMLDDGNARGVHVLTGTNRHEATLFNLLDPRLNDIEPDGVVDLLSGWSDERARNTVAEYRSRRPDASGLELWTAIGTDAVFRIPAIRMAEAQRAHGPTWMYWFTWETPVFGGVLRSTHALEIPFVFDNLASAQLFTGDGAELQGIADAMHGAWIAFARTGDPNHDGIPTWPQYDIDRRATMRFDATVELVDDPDGDDRAAWGDYRH